ncbi:Replicase polyprotein 1ab [Gossypium arboreum]|uniref:Replicase polyprotein 1ab n=1 Tax=Gossypium arboreum TaxID=29729 RepID=A0A0B0N482_GOSAR|nr:Replicase polyprotein 1ab [Gossypium arboreum]
MRNEPKTEKMGQRTKSTQLGPPHTGRPHSRVNLAGLTTALSNSIQAYSCRAQV